ncbi:MAG: hypothetical protein ACOVQR_09925 [Flavobacterium sp.]|jgi:hypothetical protein|uniref:hypothetical protein n=1 Tax=Flavobacterium sp. TaxID=239 RepID=UPI003BA4FB56
MEVIRRFVKVKDHQINIILPSDFNADEVEVIILPTSKEYQIPQWQIDEVRERTENYLKNLESATNFDDNTLSDFDKELLDFRANQPKEDFITADETLKRLRKKYGI